MTAKSKPPRSGQATAPSPTLTPTLKTDESRIHQDIVLFDRGIALFNSRHFFEAHEAWEEIWLHTQAPEKTFLQGLIQVTAAFHHHSRENLRGFKSLLRAGLLKLEGFPAEHRGLKIERLRASARRWLAALDHKVNTHWPALPKISQIKSSR